MSSTALIGWMTTGFGLLTLAGIAVLLFALRRQPIVWMTRSADRRIAFHRDAATALASAVAAARAERRRVEFDLLSTSYNSHVRALRSLDPTVTVPSLPSFDHAV